MHSAELGFDLPRFDNSSRINLENLASERVLGGDVSCLFPSHQALYSECSVSPGRGQHKACPQDESLESGQGSLLQNLERNTSFTVNSEIVCLRTHRGKMQFFLKLFEKGLKGETPPERIFNS